MEGLVWIRGQLVPPGTAALPVLDRGVLFGDGIFETLRAYGGLVFLLEAHLDRLAASAAAVGIVLPKRPDELAGIVRQTLEASNLNSALVRLLVTRGQGGAGFRPGVSQSELVVMVLPLPSMSEELYERGVSAAVVSQKRLARGGLPAHAKVTSALLSILAAREAAELGADEAILLDGDGNIAEGSSANLFVRLGDAWCTPPLGAVLDGMTRRVTLKLLSDAGTPATERHLSREELAGSSALFFTSSVRELVPIVRLDGKAVGSGRVESVFTDLLGRFRRFVGEWRP